jgi:HEPN domain-containing protein
MTAISIEEAHRLLRIAKADGAACTALLAAPGVRFANAGFHGQQAVEKALKAVLTMMGCDFGRTHNLVALAGQLQQAGQAIPEVGDLFSLLNPYAVTLRYDDIEAELMSASTLRGVVEMMLLWAEQCVAALAADAVRHL